jgi:tetratricopeptide (TPR) repeat protein
MNMRSNGKPTSTTYEATVARYQSYLLSDPANVTLWLAQGDLHHQAGHFALALECFEKILDLNPEYDVARGRVANVMISEHRFVEAEVVLRELIASSAADPRLLHNLGLTLYFQERWLQALEAFNQAQTLGVDDIENLRYRIYALHHLGETEQALSLTDQWLQLSEHAPATEAYVALLEMDNGDMRAAQERANRVLQRLPTDPTAAIVSAYGALEQQDISKAGKLLRPVSRAEPENPRVLLGLALVDLHERRIPDAIVGFERTLAILPDNVGVAVALGWAQIANDDLLAAESTFRRAIDIERNFGEAHGGLASVLALQQMSDPASKEIRRARRLNPEGFGYVFAETTLLEAAGKREQAVQLMGRAMLRRPTQDAMTIIEALQLFARRQAARQGPPPALDKPDTDQQ